MKSGKWIVLCIAVVVAGSLAVTGCKDESGITAVAAAGTGGVINSTCPIMASSKIDPANVPANLVRTHKGKKVGFCCADCPTKWDSLTDAEKDAYVAKQPAK